MAGESRRAQRHIMAAFSVVILAQVAFKIHHGLVPIADAKSVVGITALAANLTCLRLLWQHRGDDMNMRSASLRSRNDISAMW
jgi:Co/Zn/Cd efflux system component